MMPPTRLLGGRGGGAAAASETMGRPRGTVSAENFVLTATEVVADEAAGRRGSESRDRRREHGQRTVAGCVASVAAVIRRNGCGQETAAHEIEGGGDG